MAWMSSAPETITFYGDPISPYSWLATRRLAEVETATGAAIECVPVLFGGLLSATDNYGPAEIPVKRRYVVRDVMRRAAALGVPFRGAPVHPYNPITALRSAAAVEDGTARGLYLASLHDAVWGQGRDLTEPAVLVDVATGCGLDGAALLEAAQQRPAKDRLRANTQAALDAGVFGVPSFVYRGEVFWGEDRIADLIARVCGVSPAFDDVAYQEILNRPQRHRPGVPAARD